MNFREVSMTLFKTFQNGEKKIGPTSPTEVITYESFGKNELNKAYTSSFPESVSIKTTSF